jgi:serine/threonine protein kinase/WD40 repeat protein
MHLRECGQSKEYSVVRRFPKNTVLRNISGVVSSGHRDRRCGPAHLVRLMDSSDSLQIDEHLARLLAAYDQGIDGGDGKAPTIGVSRSELPSRPPLPGEHPVPPLSRSAVNEGSVGEVLPDSSSVDSPWASRFSATTPAPPGGAHRIGRFELRRQLGKGGCGIVFLAFDPKLERDVALKIPRPEMLLSPEARRRLVREALAAAEFDHPNLVPVYETGEIGPICFIATAFCPGQTLGEWLDKQSFPVPVRQAARLIATIAEAVQHAHDRGVLHRDLKPNNVILQSTQDDPQELDAPHGSCQLRGVHYIPRVVDFGLAKLLERGGPSDTNTRQVLGTPKYMAPEQAQARHDDVGPPADVYALGVILYELLAGCAPYEGASDVEVLRQSIEGHLKYPRHIRPDIPRDLEAICVKAMDRTPARRYRTAIDLADDLRRFLDGKPTIARPLNWAGRSVKWLRRNDQIVALGVVTIIAVVLLAVGGWYVRQTQQLKDDQEQAAREQAARDVEFRQDDQRRKYAGYVRDAFLAWRSGNSKAAMEAREAAAEHARMGGELEDFPLRYLAKLLSSERLHITCPAGRITALAVSDDGKRLASGHIDGTLAIWDRTTGQQLASLHAHDFSVTRIAFASGGLHLITLGGMRNMRENARVWTVAPEGGLTPIDEMRQALPRNILCLAVAEDSKTVYAGSQDGWLHAIRLSDPSRNRSVRATITEMITAVSLLAGDRELLIGTDSGRVLRYSTELVQIREDAVFRGPITAIVPGSPSGAYTVGSNASSLFAMTPLRNWLPIPTRDRLAWLALLPDGGLAANDGVGRVMLLNHHRYSMSTGDLGAINAGVVSRDGQFLFTGGEDGIIRSWQLGSDVVQRSVRVGIEARAIAVHPDGVRVMVTTPGLVNDHLGTQREGNVPASGHGYAALRIPAEGPAQGIELRDQSVVIRDPAVNSSKAVVWFDLPDGAQPVSAHLSADGSRLAVGDDRGRVIVWTVAPAARVALIECGTRGRIDRVILSDDGKRVAARMGNGILISAVDDSKARVTVTGDDQAVFCFVPTGDYLVSGDRGGVVRIWSVENGQEEFALFGHVGRISGIGVSPDGRTIVSGGATGEIKFWDIRTSQELMSFQRHSEAVTIIEFAQNGKLLVTGGGSQVAFWEAVD